MELEFDIEEYPEEWSKEIVKALEDYKNGEKNSEKELRKFVNREISEYYYNELIERYGGIHRINKDKKERERLRNIKRRLCIAASIIILLSSMAETLGVIVLKYGEGIAFWYLLLWLWACHFISEDSSEENRKRIRKLDFENERLKDELAVYKHANKELEAKLEDINNASQQN